MGRRIGKIRKYLELVSDEQIQQTPDEDFNQLEFDFTKENGTKEAEGAGDDEKH